MAPCALGQNQSDALVKFAAVGIVVVLWTLVTSTIAIAQQAPRYQALLQNGQRVQGKALADWHEPQRVPRLDGQPLLEPGNPARWLRDRSQPLPEVPTACVELHTGDCLPGNTLLAFTGLEAKDEPLPAHVLVEPRVTLEPTKERPVPRIRVATQYIRRIIWQRRRKLDYQPGNLFFRDGRTLQFQAYRLDGTTVQILLDEGAKRVPFSDISELHLPALAQPWQLHFDELATLCTKPETRLWQVETAQGLIVTSSPERFSPRFEGNANDSVRWVHALQPAWSLDPLWIPVRDVATWRFFAQHEVPLQRACELHRGEKNFLTSARWVTNRNILDGPLRSLTTDFGSGLGLQAPGRLSLPLPVGAVAMRSQVCLDRISGNGGCARVRIKTTDGQQATEQQLWESPLLLGAETVADTGRLALQPPAAGTSTHLIIELDQMHAGRPLGADPLDIRDHVNLGDAWLELDTATVQQEIASRWPQQFVAWKHWDVAVLSTSDPAKRELLLSQERRNLERREEGFQPGIVSKDKPLVLTRELTISPADQWLVVAAARLRNQGPPGKIEVRIAGKLAAEFEVPELRSQANETSPLAIPLEPYRKPGQQTLPVEIRQQAGPADAAPVRWRAIYTAERAPNSHMLYEDGSQLTAVPSVTSSGTNSSGTSQATFTTADRFAGRGSLQLKGNGLFRLGLNASLAIRERPEWGEYRFVRFAVRRPQKQKKEEKGRFALEFEASAPGRRPYRLDTGKGKPAFESAVRVWDGDLPEHWIVITRDLFADFGEFEIRDLLVSCFEGESVGIDHIYLGRSPGDLDRLPPKGSSYEDTATALKQWNGDIDKRVGPALVGIEFRDGRWTGGVVIKPEGEILVPAHALGAPNEEVTVHTGSGKTYPAKTKGYCRDRNLGMIKIEQQVHINAAPTWDQPEAKLADDYVAMLLPAKLSGGFSVTPVQAEVKQVVRGQLWSPLEAQDWQPGGVLFHRHGYIMGINVGRHPLGGLIFERPIQGGLPDPIGRIRNGEVFGNWTAGNEPFLGFTTKIKQSDHDTALVVDQVRSPVAAAAGFLPGDQLLTCEGKSLASISDLGAILEQKDAGQEITFAIIRGGNNQQLKLKLQRREP
ncbi:PDZ domain-containing protein [Anatilimnocola sp. NA78]|uniref:PDZ domain-containing protein n=1 Tax=Anatilimnocola sp. NA78 TaxID=3415683 RepID=UPI003CE5142D